MIFEFNGVSSDKYNLIVTKLENNDSLIARTPITGEKNRYRARENHFGTLYDNNYSFTMAVSKNPCNKDNNYFFNSNEIRRITSWLTSPQLPKLFKFKDNTYYDEDIEFFVTITEVSTEHIQKPHELIYTVLCDSPYGYTPLINHSIKSSSTIPTSITVTNNSDSLEDYVYPLIKIHPNDHGNITLKNITDDGQMSINSLRNDNIYIDCQRLKIYDTTKSLISFEDLGIADVDSIYWLRLCSGENKLEFTGNAQIEISYREPRKVGAF